MNWEGDKPAMRMASDKKSISSRLVHSSCVRVNPAFDGSN